MRASGLGRLMKTIVLITVLGVTLACSRKRDVIPLGVSDTSVTQQAIRASKEVDLHEAMIVGCESAGDRINIHAYNKAFHFEAQSEQPTNCSSVVEGTIGTLQGDKLRIGNAMFHVWVSMPRM